MLILIPLNACDPAKSAAPPPAVFTPTTYELTTIDGQAPPLLYAKQTVADIELSSDILLAANLKLTSPDEAWLSFTLKRRYTGFPLHHPWEDPPRLDGEALTYSREGDRISFHAPLRTAWLRPQGTLSADGTRLVVQGLIPLFARLDGQAELTRK